MKVKIGVIIQARMGSSRFPGKVLEKIGDVPILKILVNRLKKSKFVDEVVVATTIKKRDDIILNFCEEQDITYFRGNENDVLKRYIDAAKNYNFDIVIRATADNPLTSTVYMDKLIDSHIQKKSDYTFSEKIPLGTGVEIVNRKILERLGSIATDKDSKEHVTYYIKKHPNDFIINNVDFNLPSSGIRLTIDTKEDLDLMNRLYKELGDLENLEIENVLDFLQKNPDIKNINTSIQQKVPLMPKPEEK